MCVRERSWREGHQVCVRDRTVSKLYLMLQLITSPSGNPDVDQFRLVEMFKRVQTVAKHAQVLKMFLNPAGSVKLII